MFHNITAPGSCDVSRTQKERRVRVDTFPAIFPSVLFEVVGKVSRPGQETAPGFCSCSALTESCVPRFVEEGVAGSGPQTLSCNPEKAYLSGVLFQVE